MSHKQLYRQCKLVKGNVNQVTWLPTQFAKEGKKLSLQADGEWDDGWIVDEAYEGTRSVEDVEAQRDALKRWQEVIK